MENKLLIQDIAAKLAAKKKIAVRDAETFVKLFFSTISEKVIEDKLVKIKGLGTFKLIDVQDRESVNVNTGERIIIRGHSKVSFTPDAELKNKVNKPFELFQTIIINEGTNLDDMERIEGPELEVEDEVEQEESGIFEAQDTEDENITEVAEVENIPQPAYEGAPVETEKEGSLPEADIPAETASPSEAVVPSADIKPVDNAKQDEVETQDTDESMNTSNTESAVAASQEESGDGEKPVTIVKEVVVEKVITKYPCCGYCNVAIIILVMVISYLLGSYHVLSPLGSFISNTYTELTKEEEKEAVADESPAVSETPQEKKEEVIKKDNEKSIEELASMYAQLEGGEYLIIGTKSVRIMKRGDNLYMMAKEELGSKDLMKYIVVHNNFKNPNSIHLGKEVKIPELRKREDCN